MASGKVRGIIFDYGGTIDSRGQHWSWVLWRGWQRAGVEASLDEFRHCYVHAERELASHRHILPCDDFHTLLYKKAVIELEELERVHGRHISSLKEIARSIADYCDVQARECVDECVPALESLAARMPLALVSNFYGNIDSVLRAYGIRHYFSHVIESAVVGVRKPDPRIFQLGVVALGIEAEDALVVGDSYSKDIEPARAIGCHTAWLRGRGWEEKDDEKGQKEGDTKFAEFYINCVNDVLNLPIL